MYPGAYAKLRLLALEPHDLVLTKLERHSALDREDTLYLESRGPVHADVLKLRYDTELRPYYGMEVERHDRTLRLWLEAIREVQGT